MLGLSLFVWGPTHVNKKTKGFYPFVFHIKGMHNARMWMMWKKKRKRRKERGVRHCEVEREKGKDFFCFCFFFLLNHVCQRLEGRLWFDLDAILVCYSWQRVLCIDWCQLLEFLLIAWLVIPTWWDLSLFLLESTLGWWIYVKSKNACILDVVITSRYFSREDNCKLIIVDSERFDWTRSHGFYLHIGGFFK